MSVTFGTICVCATVLRRSAAGLFFVGQQWRCSESSSSLFAVGDLTHLLHEPGSGARGYLEDW